MEIMKNKQLLLENNRAGKILSEVLNPNVFKTDFQKFQR